MRRGRIVGVAAGVALVLAPSAVTATPDDIARDLADGRLDGTYTRAELSAFVKNATVQAYPQPGVAGAEKVVTRPQPASRGRAGAERVLQPARPGGALPFTGIDLVLMTAGGAGLLALGAAMRRVARNRR